MANLFQIPMVDARVAALLPHTAIPGEPDEGLCPEECCSDQILQRARLGVAWVIKSATTAFFFNRVTLFWLSQLQNKLPPEDSRLQQDLNKINAAVQFSADATLNSARFASKSMASTVAVCQLVWLRHWQADTRHKWHLAFSSFTGGKLFGSPLEPFLVESKDKRKILPSSQCKTDT